MRGLAQLLRRISSSPGFTIAAVAVTALGVGAATSIFSVINAVLLSPISPVEDRVVVAYRAEVSPDTPRGPISLLDLADWRAEAESFEALGAFGMYWGTSAVGEGTALPEARHVAVTPYFFDAIGVQPALGRGFLPEEAEAGAEQAVVVSHRFWERVLGGDPEALGETLELDVGTDYTIVGIMPRGFSFPNQADLWSPARLESPVDHRFWDYVLAVGKLAPGATVEQARAELELIDARVWEENRPYPRERRRIELATLSELALGEGVHASLSLLAAAVALLVLVTAVNLLGLSLVRALTRRREIAIRSALGATGLTRVGSTLWELGLVCVVGGASGAWLAKNGLELLIAFGPTDVPRLEESSFDGVAAAFALALTLALFAIVSVASAVLATRWPVLPGLAATAPGSPGMLRLGRGFAIVQMAATVYLVIGAALLAGSLLRLGEEDLGYNPEGVLSFVAAREETLDAIVNSRAQIRMTQELLPRLQAIPGVRSAAAVAWPPMSGVGWQMWFVTEDQGVSLERQEQKGPEGETIVRYVPPRDAMAQNVRVTYQSISGDYFQVMGISLLEGRTFDDSDDESSQRVVIVSKTFAEQEWPGESAVGKHMLTYGFRYDSEGRASWQVVVGVVEDARYATIERNAPAIYVPMRQSGIHFPRSFVLRTSGDAFAAAASARAALADIDPTARMERVRPLDAVVADALVPWQFNAGLIAVFAAAALALAATGLFSTLAQFVSQRTRELGIRLALGATGSSLRALVLGMGARLVFWGVAIGLALAIGTSRFLEAHLYGVTPTDPVAYAVAASVAALAALLACYAPAARAARTHPSVALRQE